MSVKFKNTSLLFILLAMTGLCFPQGGFKKKYFQQNSFNSKSLDAIEVSNNNLITIGLNVDTLKNRFFNRLCLIGTNALGNELWRKYYGNPKFQYLDKFYVDRALVKDSTGLYYSTSVYDSIGEYCSVLIKFNYNGDTLWQKIYKEPLPYILTSQSIAKSVDGGLLLTGYVTDTNGTNQPLFLMKTDVNGNELWRKKYNSSNATHPFWGGNRIIQDSLTKKIVIIGFQYIGTVVQSLGICLDSLGTLQWQKTFNNYNGEGFPDLIQTQDKNFLSCGSLNMNSNLGNWPRYKSLLVKFDVNGVILWTKAYDTLSMYNSILCLVELSNQDLLLAGNLDTLSNYNMISVIKPQIIKTDKNGNLKWKRYVGDSYTLESSEYVQSLNPISDHGFLIATWFPYANTPPPFRLIKIDSTGCDTLEAYCKNLALGLAAYNKPAGFEFDVFPNPAKDRVYVKADLPMTQKATLRITDISGRELEELILEPGKEYEINTSSYSAGVFLASFIYSDRVVETRRLVILK